MLRFLTAGESHGKGLTAILEGLPAGLKIDEKFLNGRLEKRQAGFGRGGRMKIEADRAEILSGLRNGLTMGGPIAILIKNRDWENWKDIMDAWQANVEDEFTSPRPGHADLSGAIKFNTRDIRNIMERASARETASRVALGALTTLFLKEFNIEVISQVIEIGGVIARVDDLSFEKISARKKNSAMNCADPLREKEMVQKIEEAVSLNETLGGKFEVRLRNVPPGLGSFIQWDRRLDGRLAQALMSIPAIKAVESGLGFALAGKFGSQVHDEIFYDPLKGFFRKTNWAGGLEGGVSNGEEIVLRAVMKPIPSLKKPLKSVDLISKKAVKAQVERGDTCAVPAASVVAEAMASLIMADVFLEKFSGDSLSETKANFSSYLKQIKN
ncbi:MAG: chorismate synthase [Candidatus Ratteibacteria bacterium]|nr:chorismate synthase [Candidatus Ratteibacteria bacterium]